MHVGSKAVLYGPINRRATITHTAENVHAGSDRVSEYSSILQHEVLLMFSVDATALKVEL